MSRTQAHRPSVLAGFHGAKVRQFRQSAMYFEGIFPYCYIKHIHFKKQLLLLVLYKPKDMKDMESNGKGRLVRRFREAVDGPIIRRLYAKMPTSGKADRELCLSAQPEFMGSETAGDFVSHEQQEGQKGRSATKRNIKKKSQHFFCTWKRLFLCRQKLQGECTRLSN